MGGGADIECAGVGPQKQKDRSRGRLRGALRWVLGLPYTRGGREGGNDVACARAEMGQRASGRDMCVCVGEGTRRIYYYICAGRVVFACRK